MVEPLNTKALTAANEAYKANVRAIIRKSDRQNYELNLMGSVVGAYLSALPAVDGGEFTDQLLNQIEHVRLGIAARYPDITDAVKEVLRLSEDGATLITTQQQQIAALMNEHTSLIETKREQLASMDQRHLNETAEWRGEFEVLLQEKRDAESRVQSLEEEVKRLRRESTDRAYMLEAYGSMLGPTALKVVEMWAEKHVKRMHHSWGPEAVNLSGEERAQLLLEWEAAMETAVEIRDIDGHLSGEKP